jgi:hypothetical protein
MHINALTLPANSPLCLQAHPPSCNTLSWQPASGVSGGPVLVPLAGTANSSTPSGFCQSSQPVWSAYRDPRQATSVVLIRFSSVFLLPLTLHLYICTHALYTCTSVHLLSHVGCNCLKLSTAAHEHYVSSLLPLPHALNGGTDRCCLSVQLWSRHPECPQ